jgi:tripeptide aminopeptidase
MSSTPPVDVKAAEDHLMRFLAVEGLPGQEKAIGEAVIAELKKVGVPTSAIRFDKVNVIGHGPGRGLGESGWSRACFSAS